MHTLIVDDMPLRACERCSTLRQASFQIRDLFPLDVYAGFWQTPRGVLLGRN